MIFLLLTLAVGLIWFYLKKPFSYWKERGVPQTHPWLLVGDDWPLILNQKSRNEHMEWLYKMFPSNRYFGAYSLTQPVLAIKDPELIKKITVKDFDHFTDHANAVNPSDSGFTSKIMFFQRGNLWKDTRSTLSSAFTSSKIKHMFGTIRATSEAFVNHFDRQKQDFLEVEMKDTYSRFANDVIASIAFGIEIDSFKTPKNEFYALGERFFAGNSSVGKQLFFIFKSILPNFIFKAMMKLLRGAYTNPTTYFVDVIYETIEVREKNNIKRNDMINLLLEIKQGVTHTDEKVTVDTGYATVEESDIGKTNKKQRLIDVDNTFIAAQSLLFFFAGFDTVSTALSFGTYELSFHPDIQARLRKEIKDTLDECNGSVTYDALLKMKYLDMVVSEILRKWHPTSGAVDRVCTKSYTLEAEHPDEKTVTLEPDQLIWLPYGAIQRDPKYWPEPEKFDPERFSDENKGNIVPYTYFPFGVGPRNCIGNRFALLELKCIFFHVLRKYEFVRTDKTEVPLTLLKGFGIFNTAANGFWLGMRRVEV